MREKSGGDKKSQEAASRPDSGRVMEAIDDSHSLAKPIVLKKPRTPIETELVLLRQAYQEHGKVLGQVLAAISHLENCHSEVSGKLDSVIDLLSELKTGAEGRP